MTTIIAPTPWVGAEVEVLRTEHDWSAKLGVPAHITLLGPFVEQAAITSEIHVRLKRALTGLRRVPVVLERLELFEDVACLLPRDPKPIADIQQRLHQEWPHLERRSLQHVTVARGLNPGTFDQVRARVEPLLPLQGEIIEASLWVASDGSARPIAQRGLAPSPHSCQ
jgi:hypothetical protein